MDIELSAPLMDLIFTVSLWVSISHTAFYAFYITMNLRPYIKHIVKINRIKKRGDLAAAYAEIIGYEQHGINRFKHDVAYYFTVRVRYYTENPRRGHEHSELMFLKRPKERSGKKIAVFYSREDPQIAFTSEGRETKGLVAMIIKIVISLCIVFAVVFGLIYYLGPITFLSEFAG